MIIDGEKEKSEIELQREQIPVTVSTVEEPEVEAATDDENKEVKEEAAEGSEERQEEIEEEVKTSEEKQEELETQKAEAKTEKEKARFQRRIDKEVAKRKEIEQENVTLKAQLEAKNKEDGTKFTKEDVEREAKRIASETVNDENFTRACNTLFDEAKKIDKDFKAKTGIMREEVGLIPRYMIEVLENLDNGGAVLAHLTNNLDEAEEIFSMTGPRATLKLAELSSKLITEAKPKVKAVSKVPPPNEPVTNNGRGGTVTLHSKMTDEEWITQRNKDVAQKRANGRTSLR